jgi:hypothetical protein
MRFFKQLFCEHDFSEEVPITTRARLWFPYATHDKCSKCGKVDTNKFDPHFELEPKKKKKYKKVMAWIEVEDDSTSDGRTKNG